MTRERPGLWRTGWRDAAWAALGRHWDVLVVGGGITGAGILREAARRGLTALLVEQRDFAWGTSSRSSKLVHGGLRYLKEGKLRLTRASVTERERLVAEAPGLVERLGFLLATYEGASPGSLTYRAGLSLYDLLAVRWSHQHYDADAFRMLAPHITERGLKGGFRYGDAQTDDARLVVRVLKEAVASGATALSYAAAEGLIREDGVVTGVRLRDRESARSTEVRATVVVNATGAWADELRAELGAPRRIRPLRGSHITFPAWRFPLAQAVTVPHPRDGRPVFFIPWEGATLIGTTDVDHALPLDREPAVAADELHYLFAVIESEFPSLGLTPKDVMASFSGVRPVINTGKADPSRESRDHAVWDEDGLLTVTGGKLTTFRLMALDALKAARHRLPALRVRRAGARAFDPVEPELPGAASALDDDARRRLVGRYGAEARALVAAARPEELAAIPGTRSLWAELRWAARAEGVVHLEDLLLRRVRLGLLLPDGARDVLPDARKICQAELGWDDARWERETDAYLRSWRACYSVPADASTAPQPGGR
ncbi:MAG TPA: glycerol-3-phosphate dehydrogenase/oxidase [Gemmatimonadales bacterium]|nr:glycerol-3-phosphate dehydrogenase/oxidase [Gemmatimonadales bacterium]